LCFTAAAASGASHEGTTSLHQGYGGPPKRCAKAEITKEDLISFLRVFVFSRQERDELPDGRAGFLIARIESAVAAALTER